MKVVLISLALGALAASAGLNYVQARRAVSAEREAHVAAERALASHAAAVSEQCCDALALTPEQREQMVLACAPACSQAVSLAGEADSVLAKIEAAIAEPAVDREKVRGLIDELCGLRRKELEQRVEAILAVRDALTPEQIAALTKILRGKE